jgi:DNA-directed RNA polymerase subunit RPC12/RpoP
MKRFSRPRYGAPERSRQQQEKQFESLRATELYCPKCRRATPVRERLLLVLPEGDKYEYLCVYCGTSLGDKIEKGEPKQLVIL